MKDYANEFKGKKVLVTGGSRGISAATAKRLIDGGATVAVIARSRHEQTPAQASFIQGDITTLAGANAVAEEALKILEGLDILVNNAGVATPRLPGIEMIIDEDWIDSLMINFMSAVRITNPLLNALRQSSGAIVNVTSGGVIPFHGFRAHYGASKAALSSYTMSLAKELAPAGVRVNLVTPGAIITPGGDAGREQLAAAFGITVEQLFEAIPLEGRPGTAEDMTEMIAFLVSDHAAYITGHNHFASGGQAELA